MAKSRQLDLFKAETTWFHVFKDMIESGEVAELGPYTVTVYLVVKSYTNFSTGRSFPSIDLVHEKSGISKTRVKQSLKVLEEHGYITKTKKGRRNEYTLREKVHMIDSHGRPAAVATWDYLPSTVEAARAELLNFKMTGKSDGQIIHIENFTMNVQINQEGHNQQINFDQISDPEIREKMIKFFEAHHKTKKGQ